MSTINRRDVCFLFALTIVLANAPAHALDKELIEAGVRFQDQFCRQQDEQIDGLQKLLDKTKSTKTATWRKSIRNQIAEIAKRRDDVAENRIVIVPSLSLVSSKDRAPLSNDKVGDFGMISPNDEVIIQKESGPTTFYGLAGRGRSFETIIAVGWKHAGLEKKMVVPPRDTVKYGSGDSDVTLTDIRDSSAKLQNDINAFERLPKKAQVRLPGVAVITKTVAVTNAFGTPIDGSCECKVVELVCTEDELIKAVKAARNAAKKSDKKD